MFVNFCHNGVLSPIFSPVSASASPSAFPLLKVPISDSSEGEESHSESNDVESDSESDQERIIQQESSKPCHHCQNWNMFVTAVVKCPRCFWHDNNSICLLCGYDIPVDNEHIKEAFAHCNDCGATCYENMKTSKVSLYFPSED